MLMYLKSRGASLKREGEEFVSFDRIGSYTHTKSLEATPTSEVFLVDTLQFAPDLLARGLVAAGPRRRLALARAVVRAFALRAALHLASFAA